MLAIYIASPISTFSNPKQYYRIVDGIKRFFVDAFVYPARNLYSGNHDWLNKWPILRDAMDMLVFFSDKEGYIGAGVYQEILDMLFAGKPVYYRDDSGNLHSTEEIRLELIGNDFGKFARVILETL